MRDDDWKLSLRNSFGAVDRFFCGHPLERDQARRMLAEALAAGVTLTEIEAEARRFLTEDGCSAAHVKEQIAKLHNLRSYFTQ